MKKSNADDLATPRSNSGVETGQWNSVMGQLAEQNSKPDEGIEL